ncbi:MAG: 2-dehydropantoate 2-reductase [Halopseudomonas sabulinigri]|jgi:2-dehydropantoate 2-reductase
MMHVLGAGSLGLLWLARLQQAGQPCSLLVRNQATLEAWRTADNKLIFEQQGHQSQQQANVEVATTSDTPIQTLIVATKAHSTLAAVESVRHRLSKRSQILLLQNGLGAQQQVSDAFTEQRVLYASVTDGAWQPAPRHVIWAGQGTTLIGDPLEQPAPEWLKQLDSNAVQWQWDDNIVAVLWRKLAVNCAINPFTLLFDCVNGEVPNVAGSWLDECIAELQALLTSQAVPHLDDLATQIYEVIRRTANNSSSMRQDLHAKRRTELNYILGYACRQGQHERIPTPALNRLLHAAQQRLAELDLPVD